MSDAGAIALTGLLDEGLDGWLGLPPGQPPEAYAPVVDAPGEDPAMGDLGMRKALIRFGELKPAGVPAELWVSPHDAAVWMLAIDDPPFAGAPTAVRERLGEPALILDSARGTVALPGSEWVYPGRDLTVFVEVPENRVWRVALFPASSAGDYAELYRARIGQRRLPLPDL